MRIVRRLSSTLAVCVVLSAVSQRAQAQTERPAPAAVDGERPPRVDEPQGSGWYGWQTLIADGASFALSPVGIGVVGFWFATPAVHAGHGRFGIAAGSAAIRLGVTLLPAALWMSECFEINLDWNGGGGGTGSDRNDTFCDGLVVASVVGVLGTVALDAAVFAHEPPQRHDRARVHVAPWARTSGASTDAGLRLAGRF